MTSGGSAVMSHPAGKISDAAVAAHFLRRLCPRDLQYRNVLLIFWRFSDRCQFGWRMLEAWKPATLPWYFSSQQYTVTMPWDDHTRGRDLFGNIMLYKKILLLKRKHFSMLFVWTISIDMAMRSFQHSEFNSNPSLVISAWHVRHQVLSVSPPMCLAVRDKPAGKIQVQWVTIVGSLNQLE